MVAQRVTSAKCLSATDANTCLVGLFCSRRAYRAFGYGTHILVSSVSLPSKQSADTLSSQQCRTLLTTDA